MNKQRRKEIEAALQQIDAAKASLEALRDEEQDYLGNMPESLQGGAKGEQAEAAIAALEEAIDGLDNAHVAAAGALEG